MLKVILCLSLPFAAASAACLSDDSARGTVDSARGTVSGRAYWEEFGMSGRPYYEERGGLDLLILVAPASRGTAIQTIQIAEYAPDLQIGLITGSQREGAGFVRSDRNANGSFTVTALADGEYFVILAEPFITNFKTQPAVQVLLAAPDRPTLSHRAHRVKIDRGRVITDLDFVFGTYGTGSLKVNAKTHLPGRFEIIPDRIVAVEFEPPVPQARIMLANDEALVENIPPGRYLVKVTTATRGFSGEVLIRPGITGLVTQTLAPPSPGSTAGQPSADTSRPR